MRIQRASASGFSLRTCWTLPQAREARAAVPAFPPRLPARSALRSPSGRVRDRRCARRDRRPVHPSRRGFILFAPIAIGWRCHRFPPFEYEKEELSHTDNSPVDYCASSTLRACCSLASSRSSWASSSRIPATRCSCLSSCSRTTSTGVFLIQALRPVEDSGAGAGFWES